MTDETQWARARRGSPVNEFLAHDAAVLPFLDRNLGVVYRAPLRVVDVDPPDHECPVARDHISVVGQSSHGRDFGKEVLLEGAVSGLANTRRLVVFLHDRIFGVVLLAVGRQPGRPESADYVKEELSNCSNNLL